MPAAPFSYQSMNHHQTSNGTGGVTSTGYSYTSSTASISNSNSNSNSTSRSSSKQTSPAPSNQSGQSSNRGSPAPGKRHTGRALSSSSNSKGKLFQCTGFGDCRMVFTRSEHLARHARKHTGEKPFQCVVDGCTRMFSRFDNMVQHTQTHTKGPRRSESAAGIASKIAIESRRKSEAGLLGTPPPREKNEKSAAGTSKATKLKRASVSSASGSETATASTGRKNRVSSMPTLNMIASSSSSGERTWGKEREARSSHKGDFNGSSYESSSLQKAQRMKDASKIRKKNQATTSSTTAGRRASLGSTTSSSSGTSSSTTLSWYASKLHPHRSSVDSGATLPPFGRPHQSNHGSNLDAHLPPMNLRQYEYALEHPSKYRRGRHPLSPGPSSHSEEDEDDDDDDYEDSQDRRERRLLSQCSSFTRRDSQHQPWGGMVDSSSGSMNNCTLPPLRGGGVAGPSIGSMRLPSISSSSNYRSHSISHEYLQHYPQHHQNQTQHPEAPRISRRLSLADLETPIHETKKVVDQSIQSQQAQFEGVDVSEDEIHALEAFGELWAQGRDVGMEDVVEGTSEEVPVPVDMTTTVLPFSVKMEPITTSIAALAGAVEVKSEFEQVVPGMDTSRRSPRRDETKMKALDMAMDLD